MSADGDGHAPQEFDFLADPEMRGVRLELEFMRTDLYLRRAEITSTVVVFGGTRIVERAEAQRRLEEARGRGNARGIAVAERVLAKCHYYDAAREFGRLCAKGGMTVMTGGGPGIMEAANRGAHDEGKPTVGLNIHLPHEQEPNDYITPGLCFQFRYFAMRKMHFLLRARALVCFPGGFGTLDEMLDALTLRQTRRMQPIPVILFGRAYWESVVDFRFLADEGVIAEEDLRIVQYAESAGEAWGIVTASP